MEKSWRAYPCAKIFALPAYRIERSQQTCRKLRECRATYLDSCFEGQESIPRIAHLEYSTKPILRQISYLQNLQLGRDTPQVELINQDIIDDYRRLWRFIEGSCEQLLSSFVEVRICRQRRPVEVKSHVETALDIR